MIKRLLSSAGILLFPWLASASEADLLIPDLTNQVFGMNGSTLLWYGFIVILAGVIFGAWHFIRIKNLPVHESMANVSATIYETCKTYLFQQGKFLAILFLIVGAAIVYYFLGLVGMELSKVVVVLLWSILGILGSYSVAWFGIRINTLANSRTSFASLRKRPWDVVSIPLSAGMSVGMLLICVELIMMLFILLLVPGESAGACFVGFAIGESLGASALRIAGGIFTKIADIGSDLMKIVFNIGEDDPRNPGVIADCTGDNAGDSVGPTADGFETYGVTGVALISFIVLSIANIELQSTLIVWIFAMRILMVFTSAFSYQVNHILSKMRFGNALKFNFETPLTNLVWMTSIFSILVTYAVSYFMLGGLTSPEGVFMPDLWWQLATIISCGTFAAAIIPEFTKAFTSAKSKHVSEVVTASREGGPSLNILSGMVAGNFSAFWTGMVMVALMFIAYLTTKGFIDTGMIGQHMTIFGEYPAIFAFGLVAFGFLGMGPVTIAVDSYGPVTDNAQSIFELSQIEKVPGIREEIKSRYGFDPDFEGGKHYLEENDAAGNTFKATAKPVLIGTAVIGATTMIFAIILLMKKSGLLRLSLVDPEVILGFVTGGAVVYWFTGASMQAVTTGAHRAVEFIKKNLDLTKKEADIEDSKTVVKICTQYAQAGMWNIFAVIFSLTLSFAFFDPNFFVAYLISIAVFGLFQAMYMANAGGAWDNAKKVVEVDLREKGTPLHEATVIGDTVGDPYKDTSSVALNPIIKFSTLFGLLAAEISIHMIKQAEETGVVNYSPLIGGAFLVIGLYFVWRSFYKMRIKA